MEAGIKKHQQNMGQNAQGPSTRTRRAKQNEEETKEDQSQAQGIFAYVGSKLGF